jgi:hypothetical protein
VSEGVKSCTVAVHVASGFHLDGRHVVLVDTPGFGNTAKSDADILKIIAAFLETSYVKFRLGLQNTVIVPSSRNTSLCADTNEVSSSPVSSISTGSPMLGWMGYQRGASECSENFVVTTLFKT